MLGQRCSILSYEVDITKPEQLSDELPYTRRICCVLTLDYKKTPSLGRCFVRKIISGKFDALSASLRYLEHDFRCFSPFMVVSGWALSESELRKDDFAIDVVCLTTGLIHFALTEWDVP